MKNKEQAIVVGAPIGWKKYSSLILCALAFLLYANTIPNNYNMDDELVTRKHKLTSKGLQAIPEIFTRPYYSDNMGYAYGYRPLVHVSYAVEHHFFGENVKVSHFFNVLLYSLCVLIFFRLIKIWTSEKELSMAIIATLLFAIHPVHTEVVASLKNRDEILALLFGLLSGLAFFRNVQKQSYLHLLLSGIYFSLALLSKKSMYPIALIYPVIGILLYGLPLRTLLFYSLLLIIPGVVIVSEFEPIRVAVLFVAPLIIIIIAYFLKLFSTDFRGTIKNQILPITFDYRTILALFIISMGLVFFYNSLPALGVSFLILLVFYVVKRDYWFILASIWLSCTGLVFDSYEFLAAGLILGIHFFARNIQKNGKLRWVSIFVFLLTSLAFLMFDKDFHKLSIIVALLLIFFALEKKRLVGVIFIWLFFLASSGYSLLYGGNLFLHIAVLFIALYYTSLIIKRNWKENPFLWAIGITFLVSVFFVAQTISNTNKPAQEIVSPKALSPEKIKKTNANSKKLQEGRKLEFAENTLVLPHSKMETLGTGAIVLGEYLRLMVFPLRLSFYYGYAEVDTANFTNPWVWVSLLLHLGLIGLALWQLKKKPFIAIGILWYFFSIGLFSNWVELVAGMVGERLAFTASAGFCMTLAAVFVWIKPELNFRKPALPEVFLGLIVLAFGFRTLLRNSDWKDAVTLMGHDIKHLENSAQANNLYALNLMSASYDVENYSPVQQQNMRKLAIIHFDKALQIWPNFYNAAYDKGRASLTIGDYISAIDGFEKAVAMDNDFMDPYYQLSELYITTKRYPAFLMNAKRLFSKETERPEKYNLIARGFYLNGQADSAKFYLRKGMNLHPADVNLKRNMAEIFKAEHKPDSAAKYAVQ